ncbi:hypothetical protein OCU04_004275 [Sclerotinia nivalis]|uniref:WSC domain-containing protein n=1 Tax=Sclerotinia nivalis TaxID=352851 RepID=A0A9X0DKZ2_9HELO|nr:hypothetical protein OCU04_004275 [Sclerotinia nivalis]
MYHSVAGISPSSSSTSSSVSSARSVSSSLRSDVANPSKSSSISSSALVSTTTSSVTGTQPSITSSITPSSLNNNPSITTSTTPLVSTIATLGFASIGCFSDPAGGPYGGHNLPKLFSNDSMTPELCLSSALAQKTAQTPVTYKYIGLEYGRECYAGTMPPTPEPSSLVGAHACTMPCKGNSKESCGGPNMYNFYAATAVLASAASNSIWNSAVSTVSV